MTDLNITTWNMSSLLAHRAIDAKTLPSSSPPLHVALPGAKAAIPHDYLLAYQEQGLQEHEIAERANARWERDNAERLAAHRRWVTGPYSDAIQQMREAAAREHGEKLRREAALEQWMREREEG